jgi:crotonobetainyl-CoA:carnitine CoA-transferase CaiB-like acyl-CoA transferase
VTRTAADGPLAGLRVVELANFIAGPYAGQLLADLGAEVIKVEPPDGGDPFRSFAGGTYSPHFIAFNRNKRSLAIDIREDAGREVMQRLLTTADVLVENSRPGVMGRLGLGYAQASAWNPRLVYCSVSGFGQDGPAAKRPVYDTVGQALGGLLSQTISAADPQIHGPAMADGISGLTAAYGILAALQARARTGTGQHVDVSMFASVAAFLGSEASMWHRTGDPGGPRRRPAISQSYALGCADGRVMTIHLSSPPKFWKGLVEAVGRPGLASDPRFATRQSRVQHFEELHGLLAREFVRRPSAEWQRLLAEHDVPHARVNTVAEVFDEPQARHLGLALRLQHPSEGDVTTVAPPVRFSATPWRGLQAPPVLGEDTTDVLAELAELARDSDYARDLNQARDLNEEGEPWR